ncbi:hypothetical protein DFH05DRAFT_1406248, partial [Lentinula detonsa]
VHDISGSKLDGRATEGRWVGFDEESCAHRVYWPEKRTVSVERSVSFKFETDKVIVEVSLEGEHDISSNKRPAKSLPVTPSSPPIPALTPASSKILGEGFEETVPKGQEKRVRKESEYAR